MNFTSLSLVVMPQEQQELKLPNKIHNERCSTCKNSVKKLLFAVFGSVEDDWDLDLPSKIEEYRNSSFAEDLGKIYKSLQMLRGNDKFVKSSRLPKVDFFIPNNGLIIEFDESQHFTMPREKALDNYPPGLQVGFSVKRWQSLCQQLHKHDKLPVYRDEQRAWYDTLRDFAPSVRGFGQTIRLYSRDLIWCSLDPKSESDLAIFKKTLNIFNGGIT